ncbi:ABC transporter ATP-binding protein, partial [Mesorhizobium tamadayense]
MASVTLSSVSKLWGSFVAVEKISLAMADGEFVVLLGPSGCGKSTTMRMIAGLDDPSAGEIRIGDRVVNDLPPGKRDLAMVFQNYGLYPHMTVADNIGYPLKVAGVNRQER